MRYFRFVEVEWTRYGPLKVSAKTGTLKTHEKKPDCWMSVTVTIYNAAN